MNNKKLQWVSGLIGFALASSSLSVFADEVKSDLAGRFDISRYEVVGNTILSEQEVNQTLAPYSGKEQEFESIQKAVKALETVYRDRGYSVVKVVLPEQELNLGVVQLKVIEPRITKVSVTGNKFFDEANIRRSLPKLKEGVTPNLPELTANLRLANENPAKKSTLQLQAGSLNSEINAEVKVTDERPWSASLSLDNTGDLQTGRNRVTALYQNSNLFDLDHVLSMQYTTSTAQPNNVNIFGMGYHIPLYSLGDSVDFYGSYSNVDAGVVNAGGFGFGVSGNGTVYGTRYNHNFLKVGNYNSTLSAGFDYKVFKNDISVLNIPLGNEITVHPVSLSYLGNWAVVGTGANFVVTAIRNIPGGKDGGSSDFPSARAGANANYSMIRYGANLAHAFAGDWQVRFALNGQMTSDALVSGEQFGAGGAYSVRGFLEREVINDEGRTTNLELYTPNLCSESMQCRLLSFYDTGYVSRNDALPGEEEQQSLGSVGLGFRVSMARNWSAQTDWAHVVDGTAMSPKGSNRAHFKLIMTF